MIRYLNFMVPTSIPLTILLLATLFSSGYKTRPLTNSFRVGTVEDDSSHQENHAPVIQIVQPASNSVHQRNTFVRYSISVSDQEDGESRFDEIPSDKIFLQIEHVDGAGRLSPPEATPAPDHRGFQRIRRSDCFNCHQFRGKSIGPSFSEIARRYQGESSLGILAENIRNGSQGRWGKEIMPAHPDISPHNAELIAQWIISAGLRDCDDYLSGKEGTFRLATPATSAHGFFILTARYDDLGVAGKTDLSITGSSSIIIEYK